MKTTRWVNRGLLAAMTMSLASCQVAERRTLSMVYFSASSAGYAGRFRIEQARWPANSAELEKFICVVAGAESLDLERRSCDDGSNLPYRMELMPEGKNLRIRYYEAEGLVCTLELLAPTSGSRKEVFPMIVIKSTLLACRGGGFVERSARRSKS